jgi:hypothetical protein
VWEGDRGNPVPYPIRIGCANGQNVLRRSGRVAFLTFGSKTTVPYPGSATAMNQPPTDRFLTRNMQWQWAEPGIRTVRKFGQP